MCLYVVGAHTCGHVCVCACVCMHVVVLFYLIHVLIYFAVPVCFYNIQYGRW